MDKVPSGSPEEASVSYLSPSFWWWLAALGIPWLLDTWLQSVSLLSHGHPLLVCLCLSLFFF